MTAHLGPFSAMLKRKGLIVNRRSRDRNRPADGPAALPRPGEAAEADRPAEVGHMGLQPVPPVPPVPRGLPAPPPPPRPAGPLVDKLLGMGFSEEQAVAAHRVQGDNLQAAVDWLLNQ